MASGIELARRNFQLFEQWKEDRITAGDIADYIRGSILNRRKIAEECGFSPSAINQNPAIKSSLASYEEDLRQKGMLPPKKTKTPESASEGALKERSAKQSDRVENRVKALEEKNALLTAEVHELRVRLKKYEFLDKHLAETGRMLKF